jgi:hypothetical protein
MSEGVSGGLDACLVLDLSYLGLPERRNGSRDGVPLRANRGTDENNAISEEMAIGI